MASASRKIGRVGENLFEGYLIGLDWIVQKIDDDDQGTDYIASLDPTGRRHFAVLGFQVKTHDEVKIVNAHGKGRGHQFYEGVVEAQAHFDYWINNDIPHFLIVQSTDGAVRLWQRLDREHVERTDGGGLHVFVPESQTVDDAPPAEWLEIARERASARYAMMSRWDIGRGTTTGADDELRFALITPRLVSAHPNQSDSQFGPAQAIADTISVSQQWRRRTSASVPSVEAARAHDDERWQLAAAIRDALSEGAQPALPTLARSASDPAVRAAARAVHIVRLLEEAWLDDALAMAVADEDFSAEDRQWITTLRVNVLDAMGDYEGAASTAGEALSRSTRVNPDPAMKQLDVALLWAKHRRDLDQSGAIAEILKAADNAVSWWRNRHLADALKSGIQTAFDAWSSTGTRRFGVQGGSHNDLLAASLQARLAGAIDEARHFESILARMDMMAGPRSPAETRAALETLLFSGQADHLRDALRRCLRDDPPSAFAGLATSAVRALGDVRLRLSGVVALQMLGPYVPEPERPEAKRALLGMLERDDALGRVYGVSATVPEVALEALASIEISLDLEETLALVEWLCRADESDSFEERASRAAIAVLDKRGVPLAGTERNRILGRLSRMPNTSAKYWALVASLGRESRGARARIQAGIDGDAPYAKHLASTVGDHTPEQMRVSLANALLQLDADMEDPQRAAISHGETDQARLVAIYAVELADSDAISTLADYIASNNVPPHKKREALVVLADAIGHHPELDGAALREAAISARAQTGSRQDSGAELAGAPERLLLAVEPEGSAESAVCIGRLLAGGTTERRDLCHALARRGGFDMTLVALANDPEFGVRALAASAIAYALVSRRCEREVLLPALARALNSTGPVGRSQVRQTVESVDEVDAALQEQHDAVLMLLATD